MIRNSTEVPASKMFLVPGVEPSISRRSTIFGVSSPFPLEEGGDQTFGNLWIFYSENVSKLQTRLKEKYF